MSAKQNHRPKALSVQELREVWPLLSEKEKMEGFRALDRAGAEELLLSLNAKDMANMILQFPETEERTWIRFLAPNQVAESIRHIPADKREKFLSLIDEPTRKQVSALLAYAEDQAGGLMNPRFARLRPEMSVDEAITYFRQQTHESTGTIYYAYILDPDQRLLGVVSLRKLLSAPEEKKIVEIMKQNPVTVADKTDDEKVARLFSQHKLMAIPVLDGQGHMKGVVTLNDIIGVVQQEATEDIQKMGGTEVLDEPYLQIGFFKMIKKRGGWLTILFLGEMFTATAMGYFQNEISKAVVLALFIPLIISSGGNSGSQACTLVIRAMALGEVRLRDWWRVFLREIASGLALGGILALIGLCRILFWPQRLQVYGEHFVSIAFTVAISLVGVVLWGTVAGSILPFILRRLGFDPASASAPFVATLVDVIGLIIYFSVASVLLHGILL